MATDNYWHGDHSDNESPRRFPPERAQYFGYPSTGVGENIAGGFSTAQAVFNGWRNSPGHNSNMLNANYTIIGIGLWYDASSQYKYYWVTDFGFLSGPGPAPTKVSDCPNGAPTTTQPVATTPGTGPTPTITALPTPGGEGAAGVFLSKVVCATNPEITHIKNYGSTAVSLTGFELWSSPTSQQAYDLASIVPSIGPGETIELRSGPSATSDPENGAYVLTLEEIYRDGDTTDFAYLVRPNVNSNVLGYCSSATAVPTPPPTPVPTPTPEPLLAWNDLDCNDTLGFDDPMAILAAAAGVASPAGGTCPQIGANVTINGSDWKWGDVNCSGAVNARDAVDLLAWLSDLDVQGTNPECPVPGTLF
jgi:hypothetical protein